jgi:hypothetical protein
VAEDVTANVRVDWREPDGVFSREQYRRVVTLARAVAWSRMLDLAEKFSQIAPWGSNTLAAATVKLQRGKA